MIEPVEDLSPQTLALYDDIIDVRSPAEFKEDRLPRAQNFPVLSNNERTLVGTVYVQQSRFLARRMGAAIAARNVAAHLDGAFAGKPPKWRPLLYCWRGGQRSGAMATILSQIGWRVGVLKGGYKTWRRKVVGELQEAGDSFNLLLLDGPTGSGKSAIIRKLVESGAQAIDLEALAAHRGSVFGAVGDCQPGQKLFETLLWDRLSRFDFGRPIIVEAESAQIGRCVLPRRFWRSMQQAPHIVLNADIEARAEHTLAAYEDLTSNPDAVVDALQRLKPFHEKGKIEKWIDLAMSADFRPLALALMRDHYDPLYARSRRGRLGEPLRTVDLADLTDASLTAAAAIIRRAAEIRPPTLPASDSRASPA
jgi:tRNA 2-selenouridine synthase